jgi:glycosyltransferase involved in cell wall biosynthesis
MTRLHDEHSTVASDLSQVAVIIPALNEEAALPHVLRDLPAVGRIIVVDNGSSDCTPDVARALGAFVVDEPRRGYGAACLRGLAELERDHSPRPLVVAFIDGDYSDYPEFLPQLVDPILSGNADFVIGSRTLGTRERGALSPHALFGNRLACLLMKLLFKAHYTDLGPFRAIGYDCLRALEMRDDNFGWTVEMQIKAARLGLRTVEVPVPYRNRIGTSKISGTIVGSARAGFKILYLIAKFGWQ